MGGIKGMRINRRFVSAEASDFEEPGALCGAPHKVRENRTPGSVRGRRGNPTSYLDCSKDFRRIDHND